MPHHWIAVVNSVNSWFYQTRDDWRTRARNHKPRCRSQVSELADSCAENNRFHKKFLMFQNIHRINYCQRPCWEKLLRVCYQVSHQVTATPWKEFQLAGASRGEFPTQAAAPGPEPGTATVSRAGAVTRVFKFHERPDYIHIVQGPPDSWTGHGAEGGSGYWITLKTWINVHTSADKWHSRHDHLSIDISTRTFTWQKFSVFEYVCLDLWTDEDSHIDLGNTCTF